MSRDKNTESQNRASLFAQYTRDSAHQPTCAAVTATKYRDAVIGAYKSLPSMGAIVLNATLPTASKTDFETVKSIVGDAPSQHQDLARNVQHSMSWLKRLNGEFPKVARETAIVAQNQTGWLSRVASPFDFRNRSL